MTLTFNPSGDLPLIADRLETVAYRRRGATSNAADVTISAALRLQSTVAEGAGGYPKNERKHLPSNGYYFASDANWHIPRSSLSDPPSLGDLVIDSDGNKWTILEFKEIVGRGQWRLTTRELAIANSLNDSITVLLATVTIDAQGNAAVAWSTLLTGIRARVQAWETEFDGVLPARTMTQTVHIYVETLWTLDTKHRIQIEDGTLYDITRVNCQERLGELPIIEAARIVE